MLRCDYGEHPLLYHILSAKILKTSLYHSFWSLTIYSVGKAMKKQTHLDCWWECKNGTSIEENLTTYAFTLDIASDHF